MAIYNVQALFDFNVEANSAKEAREIVVNYHIKQNTPEIDGVAQALEMEMGRWDEKAEEWVPVAYWLE